MVSRPGKFGGRVELRGSTIRQLARNCRSTDLREYRTLHDSRLRDAIIASLTVWKR